MVLTENRFGLSRLVTLNRWTPAVKLQDRQTRHMPQGFRAAKVEGCLVDLAEATTKKSTKRTLGFDVGCLGNKQETAWAF